MVDLAAAFFEKFITPCLSAAEEATRSKYVFDPLGETCSEVLSRCDDLVHCAQLVLCYALRVGDFGDELTYSFSESDRTVLVIEPKLRVVKFTVFMGTIWLLLLFLLNFAASTSLLACFLLVSSCLGIIVVDVLVALLHLVKLRD